MEVSKLVFQSLKKRGLLSKVFVTKIYVYSEPNFMFGLFRFLSSQHESGKKIKK